MIAYEQQPARSIVMEIRCGKFTSTAHSNYALSFQVVRIRAGVPRTLFQTGAMPVLINWWSGSGHHPHLQSLN